MIKVRTIKVFFSLVLLAFAALPAFAEISNSTAIAAKVIAWRRDFHQHPELGNNETRTAAIVAKHLQALGMEVRTGIAHTGVSGILRGARLAHCKSISPGQRSQR